MAERNLSIEGDFNIYTAADNKAKILSALAAGGDLEIDLSHVSEMDSAGLQLLLLAKREVQQRGDKLKLVGHSEAVLEVLGLTRLEAHFGDPIVETAPHARSGA